MESTKPSPAIFTMSVMPMMNYERSFVIESCHFNGARQYEALHQILETGVVTIDQLKYLLENNHGHNFKVTVSVEADMKDANLQGRHWLIEDSALVDIVNEWNKCNLSLHPDFLDRQLRATTEHMALILAQKVKSHPSCLEDATVTVTVWERDDVSAIATV